MRGLPAFINKIKGRLERFLAAHPFLKNIAVLVSGNVLGYGINIVCIPIISRIYSPAQLGEYDLILSSGRFVTNIISFGLIIAIMLPKEDRKARQLCQMILTLNVAFLSALFCILIGIREDYQLFDTSFPYEMALFLLAIYLLSFNMQNVYYSYTNRCKKYQILFWNPMIQNVVNVGLSIVLGWMGKGTLGYLVGTIASYVVCCIHMQMHVSPFREKIMFRDWRKLLIEYKDITLIQMPANFIAQISNEIPTQFLGRVFVNAMLGGYTMANRILDVPAALLATPINRVVYQTMSDKVNKNEDKENIGKFCFEIVEKNIKLAILPVGFLIVFGKQIIPFVLGSSWAAAGDYIAVLGMMFLLKFCSVCVSGTFVVMKRQKLSLILSFVGIVKYGICFGLSYIWGFGVFATIVFFSILECLYHIVNLSLCVYCTHYSMKAFVSFLLKYIVGGNLLVYMIYLLVNVCIF